MDIKKTIDEQFAYINLSSDNTQILKDLDGYCEIVKYTKDRGEI